MPKSIHVPSQLYSSSFSRSLSITATLFSLILVGFLGLRLVTSAPTPAHHLDYNYNSSKNGNIEQPFQVQVGLRPYYLVDNMDEGPLKQKLQSCSEETSKVSKFVVGHRGAPLQFPEHTRESYMAAAREGAGAIECDVTFTWDKKLVCRHDQSVKDFFPVSRQSYILPFLQIQSDQHGYLVLCSTFSIPIVLISHAGCPFY